MASIAPRCVYDYSMFHGLTAIAYKRSFAAFGYRRGCRTLLQNCKETASLALYGAGQSPWRTFGWSSYRGRNSYVHVGCAANGRCCLVAQKQKDAEKPFKGKHKQGFSPICV